MSDDANIPEVLKARKPKAAKVPFVAPPATFPADAAPASPTNTTAADPAPVASKDTVMDTTTNTAETINATAADRAQAMFADVNGRAKAAAEKGAKLFEDLNAFGKGNIEAIVESTKIAAKGAETLGQDAADYARRSFEAQTAALKTLATAKSPTEFMKLHSDYVRSSFDAMVAETSRSTEAMLKLAGEIAQPLSNRFAVAADKLKVAA